MNNQNSFEQSQTGKLYLVPTPIGNLSDITIRAKEILNQVDYIAAEDTRHTGQLLKNLDIKKPMISFHEHNTQEKIPDILARLESGQTIAQVSDAGTPAISDPGELLAKAAIEQDLTVISIPGPAAFLTALVASGLDVQPFTYVGFLPRKKTQQLEKIEEIKVITHTTIFYEAPHRLKKTLANLAEVLGENRRIVLARELTKIHEQYLRGTIGEIIAHYTDNDPRGEYVLLIEGMQEASEEEISSEDLVVKVDQKVAAGVSKKDAIKEIAKQYKISKNELYDLYHRK
ncbi:16S rRNA (cytidine(1402)-2'-O)-methyltransferase [Holzapfeliella floricola]|uniref:Ribosomal RNA small subunit methyltransferase I n=1 Tax=Holzapfeliella floricola DSM 23037 = JCM 16512 TaxID=1423744 RepID=A0A0R2DVG4_9LACO|nr:16S rRNA (cytidine(1402)-2'-O)-methyltransferase [Holzapfeliella floricola]KRN04221.1 S-adenosylmethionine-dependent methyltransferase, YraL family [Holzapfeliella floricola DSM 23037 = JCM 16512]